jgi:hypothetical protein
MFSWCHLEMIGVERIRSNHVAHIHELLYQPAQHVVSAQPKRLGVKAVVTLVDAASVAALDSTLVIAMNGLQQIHARTRSERNRNAACRCRTSRIS